MVYNTQQEQNDFIINYYVLSNYSWPIDSIITGHINNSLDNMYNKYFDFYKKKQGGKCLSWHLPYSNGEIEFTNNKGKVFVIRVNGVHAAILSCYNSVTKVNSIKQIMERSKLEKDVVLNYISDIVNSHLSETNKLKENDYSEILEACNETLLKKYRINLSEINGKSSHEVIDFIYENAIKDYNEKLEDIPNEIRNEFEKVISLRVIDNYWMEHISTMNHLKDGEK